MTHKLGSYEASIKDLKVKRDHIKQNYEPAMKQIEQLNNMKKLLEAKLENKQCQGGDGLKGREHHLGNNMNVLVME